MIAFAPWESHAAFAKDETQCAAIKKARTLLVNQIKTLRLQNEPTNCKKARGNNTKIQKASAKNRIDLKTPLNQYFGDFFKTLKPYKYL
jgi:hypothetical protein